MADNEWQQNVWQQPAAPQQPAGYQQPAPQPTAMPQQPCGYPPPSAQPPKKKRGWIIAIVIIAAVFLLMLAGLMSCTSMMTAAVTSGSSSSSTVAVSGNAIGVITIDGTIQYDGTTCSPEGLKAQLDIAESNPAIKAVVLRVNSGGGVAAAGEEMSQYVKDFSKPVVVSSAASNASAAYEISSQADYIYTAQSASIGAIGTALQLTDLSQLLDKLGIKMENVTSADAKDSSYGTRPLTDEERAYYQNMVDQINGVFVQNVADGRHMTLDQVRSLATGLTFTGIDAVANGLADEIGTKEDALAKAAQLAGISTYSTIDLKPAASSNLSNLLDLVSKSNVSTADVATALKELENDGSIAQ